MPAVRRRRRTDETDEIIPDLSMVASAANVSMDRIRQTVKPEAWQTEAWGFYDAIGEFRYAVSWTAQAASRAELRVTKGRPGEDRTDVTEGVPAKTLDDLTEGVGGQAQMIYRLCTHLGVPGESYIVGRDKTDTFGNVTGYEWTINEQDEINFEQDGKVTVKNRDTGDAEDLPDGRSMVVRVWRPHPRYHHLADSAARAVLAILREIDNIGKHIGATVDSRLAGAGMLAIPKEVSITRIDGQGVPDTAGDEFMATLIESMVRPIADRDSAAAVVPILLRGPGEHLDKIRHITFGTDFDAQAKVLRDDAIRRLALGLDMAPEQLLGVGGASHWSAWQVEESTIKTTIEPLLQLICDALTRQFLVPMLKAMDFPDAELYAVEYDIEKLILRPNRASDATEAFDRMMIGPKTFREAKGFDESDAPTPEELRLMSAIDLIKNGRLDGAAAITVVDAIDGNGPPIPQPPPKETISVPASEAKPLPGDTTPDRALPTTDQNPNPRQNDRVPVTRDTGERVASGAPQTLAAPLTAAAEVLILRALERAGNKRRSRTDDQRLAGIPDHETHLHLRIDRGDAPRLLENAWTLAPTVAAQHAVAPEALTAALQTTAEALLCSGRPWDGHAKQVLADHLAAL